MNKSRGIKAGVGMVVAAVVGAPLILALSVGGIVGSGSSAIDCTVVSPSLLGLADTPTVVTGSGSGKKGSIDLTVPRIIMAQTGKNLSLAAAMNYGAYIESSDNPLAVGSGSYGIFQIQKTPPPDPNPGISIQQAEDPATATRYMLGRYVSALNHAILDDKNLVKDPFRLSDATAFLAERPAVDYRVNRQAATKVAWDVTVKAMILLGQIRSPLDLVPDSARGSVQNTLTACGAGALNNGAVTGNSQQLAALLLKQWGHGITGNPGVFQDLTATSKGLLINNGSSCGHAVSLDPRILQVLLNMLQRFKIFLDNIVTGHGCDQFFHPKGKAFDVGGATDLRSGARTNFCSGPFDMGGGCDQSGDNQAVDRAFVITMSLLLPKDAGLGQSECFGRSDLSMPTGVIFFPDSCTHQHMQIQTNT